MKYFLSILILLICLQDTKAQDSLNFTRTEIIYGRKDGMSLTMLMLSPKQKGNGKAIISLVSGNWVSSYTNAANFVNRSKIYIDNGYTVFTVMHGSQPRYSIPDAISDIKRAVRFIRYNSKEYNIDPLHIGITGSSSGGHLSLMTALSDDKIDSTNRDPINRVSARIQAVAVFFPPTDFLNWGQANTDLTKMKAAITLARVVSAFEYKEWNDTTQTYKIINDPEKIVQIAKKTSPIYSVSPDDPPVMIIHGDADRTAPLQQTETIIQKLKDANVPNQFIIKKGGGHGWQNMEIEQKNFVDWFNKYLK